ncbi:MAG: hypothetical protein K0R20_1123 [Actinomycetia bacterium]|jgi:hypothetical protein|nr:hypothetical protein [Actinomycetes bacterium]
MGIPYRRNDRKSLLHSALRTLVAAGFEPM